MPRSAQAVSGHAVSLNPQTVPSSRCRHCPAFSDSEQPTDPGPHGRMVTESGHPVTVPETTFQADSHACSIRKAVPVLTPLWEPPAPRRPGELGSRHDATTSTHRRTAGRAREAPGRAEGPIETSEGPQGGDQTAPYSPQTLYSCYPSTEQCLVPSSKGSLENVTGGWNLSSAPESKPLGKRSPSTAGPKKETRQDSYKGLFQSVWLTSDNGPRFQRNVLEEPF
ncbi:uncharacterized protein LOC121042287 [Herpailurus yagouaroundi]|uniref:uncharacterized protein LOC121042287 n=1 Tax=Herpailurus yagouaroundi TaxID=1608482 RepID=UPI001AD789AC|nr:uncharacterized protein LOC121042287 [Puma yagouaroundi]